MATRRKPGFSRRQQQLMDILYELGEAPVAEIRARLPNAPTETAVRTLLGLLVQEGHVQRRRDGKRNLFRAAAPRERAGRSALQRVVDVFFGGSLEDALAAHLQDPGSELTDDDYQRLAKLIRKARQEKS